MLLPVSQSALPFDTLHIWRRAMARKRRLHIIGKQERPRQLAPEAAMVAGSVGSYINDAERTERLYKHSDSPHATKKSSDR